MTNDAAENIFLLQVYQFIKHLSLIFHFALLCAYYE